MTLYYSPFRNVTHRDQSVEIMIITEAICHPRKSNRHVFIIHVYGWIHQTRIILNPVAENHFLINCLFLKLMMYSFL